MPATKTVRRLVAVLAAAAAIAVPLTASADPTPHARPAQPHAAQPAPTRNGDCGKGYSESDNDKDRTQSITFCDEPVDGAFGGPNGAMIVIRPTAARPGLVTPRTSFVQEMLKSVENI